MTYEEARAYVDSAKSRGTVLGLENITRLMECLGDIQNSLSVIQVAGTNGKGSTCSMLSAILTEAGYRVGKYTSPAVFEYSEIFQIQNKNVDEKSYVLAVEIVQKACQRLEQEYHLYPTYYELETAIAYQIFYQEKCDLVIIETLMGGATDATNVTTSNVCSVFTDISRDHMGFLGDTLEQIASVKAGIMKSACPVVAILQDESVMQVLQKRAETLGCEFYVADTADMENVQYNLEGLTCSFVAKDVKQDWMGTMVEESGQKYGKGEGEPTGDYVAEGVRLKVPLTGAYQIRNVALVLQVIQVMQKKGYHISSSHICEGMRKTRWPGRFQTIHKEPRVIIDGAHNEGAALQLRETIENCFTNESITYIIGVLADKEYEKILQILLPYAKQVYTVTPENVRALPAEELAGIAEKYHSHVTCGGDVLTTVRRVLAASSQDEMILAFGSLSYLKQVRDAVLEVENI